VKIWNSDRDNTAFSVPWSRAPKSPRGHNITFSFRPERTCHSRVHAIYRGYVFNQFSRKGETISLKSVPCIVLGEVGFEWVSKSPLIFTIRRSTEGIVTTAEHQPTPVNPNTLNQTTGTGSNRTLNDRQQPGSLCQAYLPSPTSFGDISRLVPNRLPLKIKPETSRFRQFWNMHHHVR
jgi:hypothetical protein